MTNEEVIALINRYIRKADYRYILTQRMVNQTTYEVISELTETNCSHSYCVTQVKNIVKKCETELFSILDKK